MNMEDERPAITRLLEQWRAMVDAAFTEGPIPGDETGHASRWEAVRMCADELDAALRASRLPQEQEKPMYERGKGDCLCKHSDDWCEACENDLARGETQADAEVSSPPQPRTGVVRATAPERFQLANQLEKVARLFYANPTTDQIVIDVRAWFSQPHVSKRPHAYLLEAVSVLRDRYESEPNGAGVKVAPSQPPQGVLGPVGRSASAALAGKGYTSTPVPDMPPGNWHAIEGPNGICACGPHDGCPERLRDHIARALDFWQAKANFLERERERAIEELPEAFASAKGSLAEKVRQYRKFIRPYSVVVGKGEASASGPEETPHHCAPSDYMAMIVRLQQIEAGELSPRAGEYEKQHCPECGGTGKEASPPSEGVTSMHNEPQSVKDQS